jgi:hypothetical protein
VTRSAAARLDARRLAALSWPPVDLSDRVTEVSDQGPRPLCVAFALGAAHESLAHDDFVPAPEPLWWWLHRHGLAGPDGALLDDGGDALSAVGQCPVHAWPYDASLSHRTEDPPSAAGPAPWRLATTVPVPLAHDGVEEELEAVLADGSPVVVIIEVTDAFESPHEDGYVDTPDLRAPSGGYHAVVVEGAWTEPGRGRVLLVRNSWGEGWGAGGFALLPVEYLVAHAAQAAAVRA